MLGDLGCGTELVISDNLLLTMLPKEDLFAILSPFIVYQKNLEATLNLKLHHNFNCVKISNREVQNLKPRKSFEQKSSNDKIKVYHQITPNPRSKNEKGRECVYSGISDCGIKLPNQ